MTIEEIIAYIHRCRDRNIRDFSDISDEPAFKDFMTVEAAKERGTIPADYHDYFRNRCDCGAEFIIKDNLTYVQCCNPRCCVKAGYRLNNLLDNFGLKGIAERTCAGIINSYRYVGLDISHIEAFVLTLFKPPIVLEGTSKLDTYQYNIQQMLSRKYTFGELISKLAIPDFGSQCADIFDDITDIDDLLKKVKEAGSYKYFFAQRGVHDQFRVYNFKTHIHDIILLTTILYQNIRRQGMRAIPICITGSVAPNGERMTKNKFIDTLNEASITKDGIQLFEFSLSSAVKSVPYIVADYRSNTTKYIEGQERNVLITSTNLLDMVKRMVIKVESEHE